MAFTLLFGAHERERFSEFGNLLHHYHRANWSTTALVFPADLPGSPYREVLRRAESLQSYIHSWVKSVASGERARSLVHALVTAKGPDGCPYSQERLIGTVAMLSWLSYETTATALSWLVFLLAQHPAILSDLIDEITAHGPVENISGETLMALPLLDAVIKESMRLITPVPMICFRMVADGEIANQRFGGGSWFYLVPYLTHRLPEVYAVPARFRPGRWFTKKPSAYEYMPFGSGQRRCPGAWLAMANLKLAVAALLSRFRPMAVAGARIDRMYAVVIMPRNGVPLDLVPRDRGGAGAETITNSGSIFDLFTPEPQRPVLH